MLENDGADGIVDPNLRAGGRLPRIRPPHLLDGYLPLSPEAELALQSAVVDSMLRRTREWRFGGKKRRCCPPRRVKGDGWIARF